jgi:integrase
MPRPAKGARLHLRTRQGRAPVWVILDEGGTELSTGTGDRSGAERVFADYLARKGRPGGAVSPDGLTVGQVLAIYGQDHAPGVAAPERIGYAIDALAGFWGDRTVSEIKGATCRQYVAGRGVSDGTTRRELGVLQAALNYCAKEGFLTSPPLVWKPDPPPARDRYLTRTEAAWLLRGARSLKVSGRHLIKFILVGIYTGTRKEAILGLRLDQPTTVGGWIDTDRGVIYRQPYGKRQTKKRQPPARLPRQILAHARRWKRAGATWAVQDYRGRRVGDIQTAWATCIKRAEALAKDKEVILDLSAVTPHTLRHTTATWLMQNGASLWEAAGFLGMSPETLERTYGHHHPDYQSSAVAGLESGALKR